MNRDLNRLFNLMSLEADGKGGAGGNDKGDDKGNDKTYSQAELDALLQSETDRRVTEALKKAEKSNKKAIEEAQKLAAMNESEKFQYELEKREATIAEKEKQLALLENRTTASKILVEKGIALDLVDFVLADDAEKTMENINKLNKVFADAVKAEVEKRLTTGTPKAAGSETGGITKEQFAKMPISERQQLYITNRTLFEQLSK